MRRKDVSWKAKGILAYIMALPIDWEIYLEELQTHATDGRDSFRTGWKELQDKGYVIRYPIKEKGKIIKWVTEVRETLDSADFSPQTEFPQVEKPQVGKPQVENPKLLSTYSTNNLSIPNTNNTHSPAEAEPTPAKRKSKPVKHKYGEFENVLLSDAELEKLKERFSDWKHKIDNLSYYIGSKGDSYKDHYRTILNWARKDEQLTKAKDETRIYEHQVTQEDIDEFNRLKAEGY